MKRKVITMDLKGNDYARVPERIKMFRADCPRGVIITNDPQPTMLEDGRWMFTATVYKDGSKREEGFATGHSLGVLKDQKAFEKLETVAIGRALAILGYLASGEIASFEEMEEYYKEKEAKELQYVEEQVELFNKAKDLDTLKTLWSQTNKAIPEILEAKNKRKAELEAKK